jgi:DNA polymerase III delta prime subunit
MPLSLSDTTEGIDRALDIVYKDENKKIILSDTQKQKISYGSGGDLRKALNI